MVVPCRLDPCSSLCLFANTADVVSLEIVSESFSPPRNPVVRSLTPTEGSVKSGGGDEDAGAAYIAMTEPLVSDVCGRRQLGMRAWV